MKTQRISPFLSADIEEAAADVLALCWRKLTPYQTVTLHLSFADKQAPNEMPAIVLSRLPGGCWLLETPVIHLYVKGESVAPLVFRDWASRSAGDFGKWAFGPIKPIWEANEETLVATVITAIEDLFFCVPYSNVPRILIGDPEGNLTTCLGPKLDGLMTKHSGVLSTVPPTSFKSASTTQEQLSRLHSQIELAEREAEQEGFQFFTTKGYCGFPQFLFLVEVGKSFSTVYVWTGHDFSRCFEPKILNSIITKDTRKAKEVVTLKRTPAAAVSIGWPQALKKLGLEVVIAEISEEEDDE